MTSIYDLPPTSPPLTIVVGGTPLNTWLGGWSAKSVIVDNHSNQHVLIPDVNVFCPPFTAGKVIPLPDVQQARASFSAPAGAPDPASVAGQTCTLTFYAEALSPQAGVPDGQVLSNASLIRTWFTVSGPQTLLRKAPPFATNFQIANSFTQASLNATPVTVDVQGAFTGTHYFTAVTLTGGATVASGVIDPRDLALPFTVIVTGPANFGSAKLELLVQVAATDDVSLPTRLAPSDWSVTDHRAAGVQVAAITISPPPGQQVVIEELSAALFQSGATAGAVNVIAEAPSGTEIWRLPLAVPGVANSVDRLQGVARGLAGPPSVAMVLRMDVPAATVAEYLNAHGQFS